MPFHSHRVAGCASGHAGLAYPPLENARCFTDNREAGVPIGQRLISNRLIRPVCCSALPSDADATIDFQFQLLSTQLSRRPRNNRGKPRAIAFCAVGQFVASRRSRTLALHLFRACRDLESRLVCGKNRFALKIAGPDRPERQRGLNRDADEKRTSRSLRDIDV